MTEASLAAAAIATKALQAGLRSVASALSSTPLDVLALSIGKDDSTVCRIRSEEGKATVSDTVRLIYAAGLKVVPQDRVCVERSTYEALATIASKAMSNPAVSRQLVWDGEQ